MQHFARFGSRLALVGALTIALTSGIALAQGGRGSGGVNSGLFQLIAGGAVEGDLGRMKFAISNALKDMTYFTTFAAAVSLQAAVARAIRQDFEDAVARGFGDRLTPSMITAQYEANGLGE